jgi:membrane-associated phospholipid phosphatase
VRSLAALSPRLALAVGGFAVAAVPVTLLAYASTHGWTPLHDVDAGAAHHLHDWVVARPGVTHFFEDVGGVFNPWVLRSATVLIVIFLLVRRQRRLAAWVGVTMLAGGVLGDALKSVVARARPQLPDAVTSASGYSFPSGHALNSMVFFAVIALLVTPLVRGWGRVAVWTVAVLVVILVGFSRVALGVHYVSDVVAGWLLGAGLVGVTVAAFDAWRRSRGERVGPVLTEGVDPIGARRAVGGDAQPTPR